MKSRRPVNSNVMRLLATLIIGLITFGQAVSLGTRQSNTGTPVGNDVAPVCPVHKHKMVNGPVPIRYGLVRMYMFDDEQESERGKLVDEYLRVKKEQFPETNRWISGGCDPGFHNYADSMSAYYCETCRRLEDEWFARHPRFLKEDKLP